MIIAGTPARFEPLTATGLLPTHLRSDGNRQQPVFRYTATATVTGTDPFWPAWLITDATCNETMVRSKWS